jgi:hypothetical protein
VLSICAGLTAAWLHKHSTHLAVLARLRGVALAAAGEPLGSAGSSPSSAAGLDRDFLRLRSRVLQVVRGVWLWVACLLLLHTCVPAAHLLGVSFASSPAPPAAALPMVATTQLQVGTRVFFGIRKAVRRQGQRVGGSPATLATL